MFSQHASPSTPADVTTDVTKLPLPFGASALRLFTYGVFTQSDRFSENFVVQHRKVSYDKNRIDPIFENCVVRHLKVSYGKNRIDYISENCVL
jgi:hypothetical protein